MQDVEPQGTWAAPEVEAAWLEAARGAWQPHGPIPRVMHQIWLGGELPARFAALRETWLALHPGWEHRLWTDADAAAFGLRNQRAFDAAPNFGEKADILRYEVLLRHGGLYVDVDFECRQAFDGLLQGGGHSLVTGFSNVGAVEVNNGLIACARGHPLLRAAVRGIAPPPPALAGVAAMLGAASAEAQVLAAASRDDTLERTGPGYWTRLVLPRAAERGILVAPPEVFYPESNGAGSEFDVEGAMCVHKWARSWQAD